MLELAVVLLLAAHLLSASVASAAPLLCVWLQWRSAAGDQASTVVGRRLAWSSLAALLLSALLGIAVGLLRWDDEYLQALRALDQRVYFGVWEYAFSLLLLGAYAALWQRLQPHRSLGILQGMMAALAATNLLYHFPFLFLILSDLASGPETPAVRLDADQFRSVMIDGYVLSRAVHFVLASFVVSGVMLVLVAIGAKSGEWASDARRLLAERGAQIALLAGLLQIPTGIWILAQMPPLVQRRAFGADALAALVLLLSVAAALVLLHQLASLAMGDPRGRVGQRLAILTALVVLLMTAASQQLRGGGSSLQESDTIHSPTVLNRNRL